MIYLLTSIGCSVWGVGGVTLFLWNTHSVAPLPGRAATWGVCSLCLHIIRGRKVPADQGRPFNPGAAVRSVLLSQDWWQLRSSCPIQIWLRVLSVLIPYVSIFSSSGWPFNNLAEALKPPMCVQSVYSHPWPFLPETWPLHFWTPGLSHVSWVFYVPGGSIILNIFLLVVWTCSCPWEEWRWWLILQENEGNGVPSSEAVWLCVRLCAPQASTLSPSEPPLAPWTLFFLVPHPPFGTLLFKSSHFCCFYAIFCLTSSTWKVYLICFSLHFGLATTFSAPWEVCLYVFPNIPHSLKVLCKHSPCLQVASESPSQTVCVPHSPLKTTLSQVTSYSVVTAMSTQNIGLGLDLNLNPRSAPLGLLDSCYGIGQFCILSIMF